MPFVAPQTITDTQLTWLRDRTGWLGEAGEHQRVIARARRFDAKALEICAVWYNARQVNELLISQFGIGLPWRAVPEWAMRGRAGWINANAATIGVAPRVVGHAIVSSDPSLEYSAAPGLLLAVGPRSVPGTPPVVPMPPARWGRGTER